MSVNASERYEVAVIGAGQAGLAIGHFLALQGRRFVILEAEDSVASAWRTRWDSLVLFTPRRHDSLPGRAFPVTPTATRPVTRSSPISTITPRRWPFLFNLAVPFVR